MEILAFSEKYSIKCVENAALEEKLHMANSKLRHFQQMQQLELRYDNLYSTGHPYFNDILQKQTISCSLGLR